MIQWWFFLRYNMHICKYMLHAPIKYTFTYLSNCQRLRFNFQHPLRGGPSSIALRPSAKVISVKSGRGSPLFMAEVRVIFWSRPFWVATVGGWGLVVLLVEMFMVLFFWCLMMVTMVIMMIITFIVGLLLVRFFLLRIEGQWLDNVWSCADMFGLWWRKTNIQRRRDMGETELPSKTAWERREFNNISKLIDVLMYWESKLTALMYLFAPLWFFQPLLESSFSITLKGKVWMLRVSGISYPGSRS